MKRCILWAAILLFVSPLAARGRAPLAGPLADYVNAADESFAWKKRSEGRVLSCEYIELTLTSQTWRGIPWKHQLFILKPSEVKADAKHGLLLIGGGNWRDELADPATVVKPPSEAQLLAVAAEQMKTPVAVLLHVPQQPIFDGKREDEIIAYTFEQFIRTQDATWPLLAPMVKSAVRGMDAIQAATKAEWNLEVATFTVTGASKRGWTTWLTGAVDDRATAIAPMVIDMLNMSKQMDLQRASFGELSEQIEDYKRRDLDKVIDRPRGKALLQIVDPYSYRERLTQPKLIIVGTNDRYWPLDAESLYWNDLPGEKYLLRIPNNGHGIKDYGRVIATLGALHERIVGGKPLPKLDWKFNEMESALELKVASDVPASRVRVWTAAAKTRDFRDATWTDRNATATDGQFAASLPRPDEGYSALFAETVFHENEAHEFSLMTNVRILPGKAAVAAGN